MRPLLFALITLGCAACFLPSDVRAEPCLDLASQGSQATFSGRLTIQLFAGPPNYESIANGDAEESALILELPARQCAADGGMFIDPTDTFDRVQISTLKPDLMRVLSSAVGRQVTVRGEAFGAHTGHHHAPLVMLATEVTVR